MIKKDLWILFQITFVLSNFIAVIHLHFNITISVLIAPEQDDICIPVVLLC